MQERKPRKPKNYGQKPLPGLDADIEAEAAKNEQVVGMPTVAMIKTYTASLGLTDEDAEEIYDSWLVSGFRRKDGTKIHDWKAAIRIWRRNGFFISQRRAAKATKALEDKEAREKLAFRRMHGS